MSYSASLRERVTKRGISYDVRFRHEGKQRTVSFTDGREARVWLSYVKQHGPEQALSWLQQDTKAGTPTVAEYAETYIGSKSGVEGKTLDHYRMFMRISIGPTFGHLPLDMVTADMVAAWVNEQSNPTKPNPVTGKLPKALAAKTIKNRHGFLYAMFQHAVKRGIIARNPCDGTHMPSSEHREMTFLSSEEYARFLAYIPEPWKPLVQLLAATGMRWGEATALRPGDFDLEAGVVRVSRAWKDSKAKGRYLGAPKTRKSKRTVAIPSGLADVVRPLVDARGEFVFTNRHGQPIIQQTFHKEVWAPARNLANGRPAFDTSRPVDKWTPTRGGHTWTAKPAPPRERLHKEPRIHDLRHTHASWLINAGVPLPVIQQRLGHESITTTVDRYGHLSPDNLTMAAIATQVAMSSAMPDTPKALAEVE